MIINTNHRGRTSTGRYAYRPLLEPEEDDFPPDSNYWSGRAEAAINSLKEAIGCDATGDWFDAVFPETTNPSWKDIAKKTTEKLHSISLAKMEEKS
jgi:hypothetical protein